MNSVNKVRRDLSREIGVDFDFDAELITIFDRQFCTNLDQNTVDALFQSWQERIPARALRIRLLVQQAAYSGLTCLITIGRYMRRFPNFPWHKVWSLYHDEMTNFAAAVAVVNGNKYYGFAKDLGVAKSTKYKDVAWIAKELLIRLNGEVSLTRYGGWPRVPKFHEAAKLMIATFIASEQDRLQADEGNNAANAPLVELINAPINADIFAL